MGRIPQRGRPLAALVTAIGLFACAPANAAEKTITVGKAAPNADPVIPINVGDKLGIFKKHGIDLKIVQFAGGSKMAQGVAAGSIDIGDGAGTEMALVAKGVPMLAICESSSTVPFIGVGVPYDSPIRSLDELKGKKIGISSTGSLTDWLSRELTRTKGWKPDDITRVTIGNGVAGIIAAFREKLIDADFSTSSLFFSMEEKKTGRLLTPSSAFTSKLASGALYASKHMMDTDPDAIRAFLAGWIETVNYIRAHKAETVKIESEVTGFSEGVMAKEYDLTISMFSKACEFDPESLATLKRSFVDLKLLSTPPDMSKLYTEAYLPK